MPMDFVSTAQEIMQNMGFDHFGWSKLEKPLSMDFYRAWLEQGHHGTMSYLQEHADLKENPTSWAPRAQSALVVAKGYVPHPYPETGALALRTALYARGEDYHFGFRNDLESIAAKFRVLFPNEEFLCFTDSAPILERDLASRAGLGWVGKNTCLIHPKKGSLFFLGQILCSLPLSQEKPKIADHCGTCDRCIVACPTQAIIEPRVLDARKCISYLTIEDRQLNPKTLHSQVGDWFFGCDICQTVCPWNEKVLGRELMQQETRGPEIPIDAMINDLRLILNESHKGLGRRFKNSPLSRARPLGIKRNALIIIANKKLHQMRDDVLRARENTHLKAVADWVLNQLA